MKLFVESGSHSLANTHWGCKSGIHNLCFISDFDNKEETPQIVPPFLRSTANIIELTKFSKADIEQFGKSNRQ